MPLTKQRLPPKIRELLLLAIDASVTHLFQWGIRAHTVTALDAGATPGEVMEVLELTSVLGVHAIDVGVPLLTEVLVEEGLREKKKDRGGNVKGEGEGDGGLDERRLRAGPGRRVAVSSCRGQVTGALRPRGRSGGAPAAVASSGRGFTPRCQGGRKLGKYATVHAVYV